MLLVGRGLQFRYHRTSADAGIVRLRRGRAPLGEQSVQPAGRPSSREPIRCGPTVTAPAGEAGVAGHPNASYSWRTLALAGFGAIAGLLVVDILLKLVLGTPPRLSEVADAVRLYEHSDPSALVIGSSHARSFDSVAAELGRRSNGAEVLLEVPLEGGKLAGYSWVLQHRLQPLIDEHGPDGRKLRARLRRAVLVTEWWDSCAPDGPALNIPGRGWTAFDFLSDVSRNGLTSFNRSYVSNLWASQFAFVGLVRNRIGTWIPGAVRQRLYPPARRESYFEHMAEGWRSMVENGAVCIGDTGQMAALDSIMNFFNTRGVQTTILLYPRKPNTLSERAKQVTLAPFAELMRERAARFKVQVIDLTSKSPLSDENFTSDFDHVTPQGNALLSRFLLDGPLSFLGTDSVVSTP